MFLFEYANPQKVVFDGEMEICNSICVRISEQPVRIFLPKGIPPYLPIIADEAAAEKDAEKENESVSV